MAFKRGGAEARGAFVTGRGAIARGWTPRVCVRLLDYTGFPRRTQRRAPTSCVCVSVCVSRQAITLMIIYDRGHTYVSPGRNWFVYSWEGFSRDAEVARQFLLLLYSYTFTSRIFQFRSFALIALTRLLVTEKRWGGEFDWTVMFRFMRWNELITKARVEKEALLGFMSGKRFRFRWNMRFSKRYER